MQRYRVVSHVEPSRSAAYRAWLGEHAARVVLAGAFAGAEVLKEEDALVADYAAPDGTLDRYVAERAPEFREEAERLFPGMRRERAVHELAARVSAPFAWETLGLVGAEGEPAPCPTDGPFTLHYVAPWCPDCHAVIRSLAEEVRNSNGRAALVGVFAPAPELARFLADEAPGATWFREPSERTEAGRMRSFHAVLRQLAADRRKWGVPATRHLFLEAGRFVVRWE